MPGCGRQGRRRFVVARRPGCWAPVVMSLAARFRAGTMAMPLKAGEHIWSELQLSLISSASDEVVTYIDQHQYTDMQSDCGDPQRQSRACFARLLTASQVHAYNTHKVLAVCRVAAAGPEKLQVSDYESWCAAGNASEESFRDSATQHHCSRIGGVELATNRGFGG